MVLKGSAKINRLRITDLRDYIWISVTKPVGILNEN